jgi:transposase
VVIPAPAACPCCGGKLSKLGEDVTETLEVVPRPSLPQTKQVLYA